MPQTLVLYSTLGCHLCEEAQALIAPLLARYPITLRVVDIAEDDSLVAAYGIRIPVLSLEHHDGDIGWPFECSNVEEFLRARDCHPA